MNPKDHAESPPRKPYTKPAIDLVELRPEEAVLGFCVSHTRAGIVQSTCASPLSCVTLSS